MGDNFLTQLVSELTSEGTRWTYCLQSEKDFVVGVVVGGHLGHSNHEMTELSIHGEVRRWVSKTATLNLQRGDFGLFRRLIDRVAWEAGLTDKGVQEGWIFFKKEVLKGARAGRFHVPKDELAGKTGLAEQRVWLELNKKLQSL